MDITEIRVKLMQNRTDRLRAFCSITIDDDFVVHDLRVIEGRKGLFVAMPSRKLTDNCPKCGSKNELRAKYCTDCGQKLGEDRGPSGGGRDKLHVDVAHPINTPCREDLQEKVLDAYREEEESARAEQDAAEVPEPEGAADLNEDYDEFEQEDYAEEVEGEEEPVEEQVDVPELEGERAEAVPEEAGQAPSDLTPVVAAEPDRSAESPAEEIPTEFGEVTAEGDEVLPSEPLEEREPEEPEEEQESEAEDLPSGAVRQRRKGRDEPERGGFGEGIL